MNIIEVKNLSKVYNLYNKPIDRLKEALDFRKKQYHTKMYALNNISFNVEKGENIGIIGTNGSGKSTLLKILTGVVTATEGEVKVNGKVAALLELGAGFNPEYTGIENIYLNGTMMGFTKEEMDKKIPVIVEFANIGEFINQPVKTYSSGMFSRLAFAVAINVEPDILIVDEALAVGDTRFQIKCMHHMQKMIEGGTTILFVSHDINSVRRFCSKALWLNKGDVMMYGETNAVADAYLDFLKLGEFSLEKDDMLKKEEHTELPKFVPGETIADIVGFYIYNSRGEIVDEIEYDEEITIEVIYDVYDEKIDAPVLGIAVRGMDDDYVCGLNTLLDKVKIPWKYGRNRFYLKYTNGILAVGGKYYFDTALFDKTASVPFPYKTMIKTITVNSGYVGEGRFIIPHTWSME